ncbi:hypothetical protein ABL840_05000 [Variovorax sp. NFACC27]|uniref:portal protein n=1 Tax=unclassified Variovorax TaxID=663243 RepID=UPI000898C925|nr:hypothetical protein SAMN03159371_00133 [Variovorax sp. NFACC28]SEF71965.1 hypothetical protein SAMN03159365_00685 [Variovorax sp. NFACC29]SFB77033.1 hypothetical protein SAMN03159379_00684 [Variovorax sp. NFACC26]SFG76659.1 hypothetical protein SAMN03159447_04807 [Variovorax sp. NFACC27]
MNEADLKALVDSELSQALGVESSKLSEQRRKALAYYYAEPEGDLAPPEIVGRSKVVSPDVRNTIESMLPQLVVKFVGGDTVVQFEPTKPGDEGKADSATKYLNHYFFKKCNGHTLTVTWAKDGLLQKRGVLKCWWDTRHEETREEYVSLTKVGLAKLMDDPEIEIIDHKEYPDEDEAKARAQAVEQLQQQLAQALQAAQQQAQQPKPPGPPQGMPPGQGGAGPGQQPPAAPMGAPQQPPQPPQNGPAGAAMQIQQQIAMIQAQPPAVLYDVGCKRVRKGGKLNIEPVPSDEFIISRGAKTIAEARLVGHRVKRTLSELKSMGYPEDKIDSLGSDDSEGNSNAERIARDKFDDTGDEFEGNSTTDRSQYSVWVKELYLRVDYDGDGIAELRKVVRAGNQILDNEIVDEAPFVSWCPVPMPHKYWGLSVADLAMQGQKTKTSIVRGQLDNMYLQVNGRYFGVKGKVDFDSLLDSRPGGVVMMDQPGMAGRLDQGMGDLGAAAQLMEQEEQALENSTGWTRYSQGNDAKGLNDTYGGVQIITNKADMRTDLMARNLAEGFVDLFKMMLKLVCQNQKKAELIRIAGEWIEMDPREWRNQFDTDINVGLGVGNKDQQVGHLMGLRQLQLSGLQFGTSTPKKIYELDTEIAKVMGFKSGDRFFNDPEKTPPPPQPNPMQAQMEVEKIKAQAHLQVESAKLQSNQQIEAMKVQQQMQLEHAKAQMQAQVDINRQRAEAEQHALRIKQEAELEAMRSQMKDSFDRWKAELDAAVRVEVANISSKSKLDNPATEAATNEIATEVRQ